VDVFSGRGGGGNRDSRARAVETGREFQTALGVFYILYVTVSSGGFPAACLQDITKGVLNPRIPWTDTCTVQASTTRRPSPHIEDGEGAGSSFHHALHGAVGMMFMPHVVYVVIC
jgi:hypothetical protein